MQVWIRIKSRSIGTIGGEYSNILEFSEIDGVRLSRHVAMGNMRLH